MIDDLETEGKMGIKEESEVGRALHAVIYPELQLPGDGSHRAQHLALLQHLLNYKAN